MGRIAISGPTLRPWRASIPRSCARARNGVPGSMFSPRDVAHDAASSKRPPCGQRHAMITALRTRRGSCCILGGRIQGADDRAVGPWVLRVVCYQLSVVESPTACPRAVPTGFGRGDNQRDLNDFRWSAARDRPSPRSRPALCRNARRHGRARVQPRPPGRAMRPMGPGDGAADSEGLGSGADDDDEGEGTARRAVRSRSVPSRDGPKCPPS